MMETEPRESLKSSTFTSPKRTVAIGVLVFVACFVATATYSLITPLSASHDEPLHWRQAYVLWSGQSGNPTEEGLYLVPKYMSGLLAECTYQRPTVAASCVPPVGGSEFVSDDSPASGYPPGFYLAVGWTIKLFEGEKALFAFRLASAGLASILVGLSAMVLYRGGLNRSRYYALLLGLTPSVLFFAGTSNPSGAEVAAVGLFLVLMWKWFQEAQGRAHWLWWVLVLLGGLGASTIRPISAALCGAVAVAACVAFLQRAFWRVYWWKVALILAVLGVLALYRVLRAPVGGGSGSGGSGQESYLTPVTAVWSTLWKGLQLPEDWVGQMGWLDAGSNSVSTAAWFAAIGVVVLVCWQRAPWRLLASVGLLVTALLVMWLYMDSVYTRSLGLPFWQPRYGAPLVVAILLLIPLGTRQLPGRSSTLGRTVVPTALILLAFLTATVALLIRYGWGAAWDGPYYGPAWLPFGNSATLTILALLLQAAAIAALCALPPLIGASGKNEPAVPIGGRNGESNDDASSVDELGLPAEHATAEP